MQNKIGIKTATIIGMNAMIGSGIFTIPGALIFSVGPVGIFTTIFVAAAVWFMALTLAKVSEKFPQEGSFYTYASSWGGHKLGIAASMSFLIGLVIAMGLLCQVAGFLLTHYFSATSQLTLGFATLVLIVLANIFGVKISQLGQYILIVLTVFPLLATIILCFSNIKCCNFKPFVPFGNLAIFKSSKDIIFSFFGFECATNLYSIVEKPEKNVPKALTYSILLVSLLYIGFAASIISAVSPSAFSSPDDLPSALLKTFPQFPWLIEIIHISIVSAIIGTIHSMVWSTGGLVSSLIEKINPKIKINSSYSILIIGLGITTTFLSLKERGLFFDLTAIFIIFSYVSSMLALTKNSKKISIDTYIGISTALLIAAFAISDLYTILF